MCDLDGELFIKPCTQQEIEFYHTANALHADLAELMPVFMGTLQLNDATDMDSINEQIPVVADHLSTGLKEEVIKMAHHLHPTTESESDSPSLSSLLATASTPSDPPTAASLLAHASSSPSLSVPGLATPADASDSVSDSVSDNVKWVPNKARKISTDKAVVLENAAYGYKKPNILDVKLGVRLWADDAPLEKKERFEKISAETTHGSLGFRIAGMRVFHGSDQPADLDEEGYVRYDKDYGRVHVNQENVVDAFRKFIFNDSAKIDEELGRAVANAFLDDLKRVKRILEKEETRMYSSSLLFVFEGDGEALRSAIDETSASATMSQEGKGEEPGRRPIHVDSGIVLEDGEFVLDGDELSDEEADIPRIYSVRLIDFAHADWTPGRGPDENTLKGVESLIRIFGEMC